MFDFFAHARKLTTNKEPGNANENGSAKKDPFGHDLLLLFEELINKLFNKRGALKNPASYEYDGVYYEFFGDHYALLF